VKKIRGISGEQPPCCATHLTWALAVSLIEPCRFLRGFLWDLRSQSMGHLVFTPVYSSWDNDKIFSVVG
jgi:hypothetical protein